MDACFIYNPNSGMQKINIKKLSYIQNTLEKKYNKVYIMKSESENHFKELVKYYSDKVNTIIVSGGDGSFNLAINSLMDCEIKPTLGYLPSGTACDNARKLSIPKNYKKAIETILNDKKAKIDIMKINKEYSSYVLAKGRFVNVSYMTNRKLKRYLGKLAYILTGIYEAFKFKKRYKLKIEYNNNTIESKFLLAIITNSNSVAGLKIAKYPPKGYLNCYFVKWNIFNVLFLFLFGEKYAKNKKNILTIRTNDIKLSVDNKDIDWSNDGEIYTNKEVIIHNEINAIEVFVGEKYK